MFLVFQQTLNREVAAAGLAESVQLKGQGIFSSLEAPTTVPLSVPALLDDFAVLVPAPECITLLENIEVVAKTAV